MHSIMRNSNALAVPLLCLSAFSLGITNAVSFSGPNAEEMSLLWRESVKRGEQYSVPHENAKFARIPRKTFAEQYLMPKVSAEAMPCTVSDHTSSDRALSAAAQALLDSNAVPSNWSWVEKGAVTAVKNQGSVGSCWAFSTTGNIEGQWKLAGNEIVSLSEEQLSDCDHFDCGVFGGWPCRAYQYVIEAGGLQSEAAYPYCEGTGACYPCVPKGYNKTFCGPAPQYCNKSQSCHADRTQCVAHIDGWKLLTTDEELLKAELVATGPISVLINAEGFPPLQFHHSGVYNPWSCDPSSLDHAVLLVGYGTYETLLGNTPYWLIKNSWGADWGDMGGYFMLARTGKGVCGVNTATSTATVKAK